jgi:hypothetical protein
MLTPEEKQRIEDEERKRIAEEQYRTEVRTKLQRVAAAPGAQAGPPPSKRSRHFAIALAVVIVVLLLFVIVVLSSRKPPDTPESSAAIPSPSNSPRAPRVRYVPVNQQIASGQVVVPARGYVQYRIEIPPEARAAHISGSFSASGGTGNDVDAVLANESEFANWINGHRDRVFYGTMGKKTTDSFDVRLGPGIYIFAVSNRFAVVSAKYVSLDVKLSYQRMETY